MNAFFNPKSIVVFGASNKPFSLGASVCRVIEYLKFPSPVYVVNSKGEDVHGYQGFTSLDQIPPENDPIDLAIILTPAQTLPKIIEACGQKGIKRAIIESAGFSEVGEEGEKLQKEMTMVAQKYDVRFLGPNCLGTLSLPNKFTCFFGITPEIYGDIFEKPGTISYIIQSGGVGSLIMDSFQSDVVNVNKMVSIGNKEDLDEADLIEYFNQDQTEVIGMYLESVKNGRRFFATAQKSKKPILVYKVGRTKAGSQAAKSHTAGLANNDRIFEAACKQAGVARLKSISELHSIPKMFTTMPLLQGKRIAIFTNSGAFGGISSDLLIEAGFEIPLLSDSIQKKLNKVGKVYNSKNPIDLGPTFSKDIFNEIFQILLSSDEIDGLLAVPNIWQPIIIEAVKDLVNLCQKYQKPAAIYIPAASEIIIKIRKESGLPSFETPEEAVRALAISHAYYLFKEKNNLN